VNAPRIAVRVLGLGGAQLVAWGTLYYAIAVLGEPMRVELGVGHSQLFGAFTFGLVLSSAIAPWTGRTIDQHGGRAVLVASALLGALAFALLARAQSFPVLVAGWSLAGVAMALGLYDACFAAIGQAHPTSYRRIVTTVTLIAGFASTVFWPLSHYLLAAQGWRDVCLIYAACLLLCAPVYWLVLPRGVPAPSAEPAPTLAKTVSVAPHVVRTARILSWAFAGTALISAAMSAHLVSLLDARLSGEQAVWVASSIGVLQVLGRVVDLMFGDKRTAVQLGLVTFCGLALAMLLLLASRQVPALVLGFALLYGVTNGLLTIAKATLPVELLGFARVGAVLGSFSAPSLAARALAPLGFAALASAAGGEIALSAVAAVALASLGAFVLATRGRVHEVPAT
jgi:hypothetical protein